MCVCVCVYVDEQAEGCTKRLYDIITMGIIILLSKPTKCTVPRVLRQTIDFRKL